MARNDAESTLHAVFSGFAGIPGDEWQHFWTHVRERHFDRREHLFQQGRRALSVHYILSGLVRLYYHEDGREVVRGFDYEGRFVTAYESVLTGGPATFSGQAIEPTRTLAFSGEVLARMYDRHPCWDRVGRRILESQWLRQIDKDRRFRVYSPEQHYRALLARRSPLIDRVPLNQLASFLQITPETLSRIRTRVRRERGADGNRPAKA
jgi:CRP-like cAMP-binding protein